MAPSDPKLGGDLDGVLSALRPADNAPLFGVERLGKPLGYPHITLVETTRQPSSLRLPDRAKATLHRRLSFAVLIVVMRGGVAVSKISSPRKERLTCAITGRERPRRELVNLEMVRPSLTERIRAEHPDLAPDAFISRAELARYRSLYVEDMLRAESGDLSELDRQVAQSLATHETLAANVEEDFEEKRTLGERLSDHLASLGGSWMFIVGFGIALAIWIVFNLAWGDRQPFDPYPFILLNLILSCLAAIQAPIIMMSQKRLEAKDRLRGFNDYQVNLKAELEIRHLHEKVDHLINKQWQRLAEIQQLQLEIMQERRR